jgi:hypothetical protein
MADRATTIRNLEKCSLRLNSIPTLLGRGVILFAVVLVAALVLPSSPRAQSPAQPASEALKPALQPFSFFLGQWDCAGEFTATKKPTAARVAVSPDLDGSWLAFRWDDKTPGLFHALELWGYDKDNRQFTNSIYDNFGGGRLFKSPGWDGDTFIWTSNALAGSAPKERFVIERKSSTSFVISWQVRGPVTDWTTGDQLTCHS